MNRGISNSLGQLAHEIMSESLEGLIEGYGRWREEIRAGIESFQAWLDRHGHVDIQQSLRIYDVLENLKNDRLILAFLAEYSRGKSELINAMFFSDFKQRLLPSDVGRTTMCHTEIFYDPKDEPYIRLLPIETRKEDPTIGMYKTQPEHWVTLRLNMSSQKDVLRAMASLAETKQVTVGKAGELGLLDPNEAYSTTLVTKGKLVQIPAWRHAMINYPHPLLKSGLVILDTPRLNALGTEPELTLRMVPNAHAVVFLLAMDTGVIKSDMEIWERYVQSYQTRRIALLNKVDLTWDELKSEEEIQQSIQRQIKQTAELLKLGHDQVIALSAQNPDCPRHHSRQAANRARFRIARDGRHGGRFSAEPARATGGGTNRASRARQTLREEPGHRASHAYPPGARPRGILETHGEPAKILRHATQARPCANGRLVGRKNRKAISEKPKCHRRQLDHGGIDGKHEHLVRQLRLAVGQHSRLR
ncbi:MAG: hypothetical protein EXR36_11225 [Betaproteobacteria bacterium]|nr:hypothetical protein [Betaproteobacteria bacterium]